MRRLSFTPVALCALLVLSACGSSARHRPAGARTTTQVSVSSCGQGWRSGRAGRIHLLLRNTDSRPGEARVVDPRTGAVFADVEPLGAGTTAPLDVTLRAGRYALTCLMEDEAPVTGRALAISGTLPASTVAAPGVVPVTQADLIPATRAYQSYVSGQLPGLTAEVTQLQHAVTTGNRSAAEHAWLTAHLHYERLGAAYDAFGDLDGAINGLAGPGWTGFHRIEHDLWHGVVLSGIANSVTQLGHDIAALRHQFAQTQIDPLQIGIRAHEISENALQFSLTGRDDYGSHSDLATIGANLQGTQVVLGLITPLLRSRHVDLAAIQAGIRRTTTALDHRPSDRPELDAALSELCEQLAPVAAVLEPRRTS